jgi:hypothetical protein
MACVGLGRTRQPGPARAWIPAWRGRRPPRCCRGRRRGTLDLLDVVRLVDLVNDDLLVVVGNESLDSEGNSDVQPMD